MHKFHPRDNTEAGCQNPGGPPPAPLPDDGDAGADARPVLTLDVALYEAMLDDPDISAEERAAFIEALWNIVVCFVDLGFGIHPLQQVAVPGVANEDNTSENLASNTVDMIDLKNIFPK